MSASSLDSEVHEGRGLIFLSLNPQQMTMILGGGAQSLSASVPSYVMQKEQFQPWRVIVKIKNNTYALLTEENQEGLKTKKTLQFSSVQLLSHVRLFVIPRTAACQASSLSPTPGACSNSCPSSWWCHPTISSSINPFSFCLQSFPASGSFLVSQFFTSVAKVLEFQLQHQSF